MNEVSPTSTSPAPAAATPDAGVPMIFRILGPARELQSRLEEALEAIGLSTGKAGVLRTLVEAKEPVPLSELAECSKCVRSNVTQLVDRLEADGLVRRVADPDDRRVTRAALTQEGRRAYVKAVRAIAFQEQEILRTLSPKEAEALARTLEQLAS